MADININDIFGDDLDNELKGIIDSIKKKVKREYSEEFKKLKDELNKSKDADGNYDQEAINKYNEARLKLEDEINAKIKSEIEKNSAYQYKLEHDRIKATEAEEQATAKRLNDKKEQYDKLRNDSDLKNRTKTEEEILDQQIKNQEEINKIKEKYYQSVDESENAKELKSLKNFDTRIEYIKKVANRLLRDINTFTDKMWFDNWKKGIVDTANNYEKYFTEIAGRTGATTRQQTHDLIKGTIEEINNAEYTLKGLNFNEDVFPKLEAAVKAGFQGQEATDIAITNAIDQKIMPWLNTSSETWTQMQYNMSNDSLERIKGQQLLLQETREGNRILQNGVVDQITDSILPSLDNIYASSTDVEDLNTEMQAKAMYLMNDMGYSKTEAIKAIQKETEAYQNPFKALTKGDVGDKLLALDNQFGTDMLGNLMKSGYGGGWQATGAITELTGIATGGETKTERSLHAYGEMEAGQQKYIDQIKSGGDYQSIYDNKVSNLEENVTATQAHDNALQNKQAERTIDANMYAHGADVVEMIHQDVVDIKNWLITDVLGGLIEKGIDKLAGKLLKVDGGATNNSGFMSKIFTGNQGFSGAINAGSNAGNAAGAGLKAGGLIGGLTQGGAGLSGGLATGGAATAIGTAGLLGGTALIGKGVSTIGETIGEWDESSVADKSVGIGTGVVMGIGGGMLGASALGLAAGPIGWAGLAIGGLAIGAKELYDHFAELSDGAGKVTENLKNSKESIEQEYNSRNDKLISLQNEIKNVDDLNEKLQLLKSAGIDPAQAGLSNLHGTEEEVNSELIKYIDNLIQVNDEISEDAQNAIDDVIGDLKNQTNEELDKTKKYIIENMSAESIKKQLKAEGKNYDNDSVKKRQYDLLTSVGYSSEQVDALQRHFANGAAGKGELNDFIKYGQVDGENIGSFEDLYEKDLVNVGKLNYYLRQYGAEEMTDYNKLGERTGPFAEALSIINQYKDSDEKPKEYEDAKKTLLNADDEIKEKILPSLMQSMMKIDVDYENIDETINSFKKGSQYIPYDQLAQLHEGERVLTKEQNAQYQNNMLIVDEILDKQYDKLSDIQSKLSYNKKEAKDVQIKQLSNLGYNNEINNFINEKYINEKYINEKYIGNLEEKIKQSKINIDYLYDKSSTTNDLEYQSDSLISRFFDKLFNFNENKQSDSSQIEIKNTTNDNIMLGLQDVVLAIQTQTKDIINYLSSMNIINNISSNKFEYAPEMGNTRTFAKL